MLTFGLTSVTFRKKSPEDIIRLTRDAGLSCIEWGGDVHVPPGNLSRAVEIGEKTRNAGLTVSSYGSYYRLGQPVADFQAVSSAAKALGTNEIRIWAGERGSADVNGEGFPALVQSLREVCAAAAGQGQSVSLEFHKNTYNDTSETSLRLLQAAGCENAKTYWQPIGDRDMGLRQLEQLRGVLTNVHVFHWDTNGKRYPLKKGEDWKSYADVLRRLPGTHSVLLEFVRRDSRRQFRRDAAALFRLFQETQGGADKC